MKVILYLQDNGVVAIMYPNTEETNPLTGNKYTPEEVAIKDVPKGKKYKIVEDTEIPTDGTFRDAWTVNESDLTDGTGTYVEVFS
tara:strand:+ start:2109 stop:2363 length:255 start_codon:yes stop_codon:yes gene_type:complete